MKGFKASLAFGTSPCQPNCLSKAFVADPAADPGSTHTGMPRRRKLCDKQASQARCGKVCPACNLTGHNHYRYLTFLGLPEIKAQMHWNSAPLTLRCVADFYKMDDFLKGITSLKSIELNLLGNIEGKSVLHLQCHFGQDSISLSKMGAQVTAVDFSENAIQIANNLNIKMNTDVVFINCDLYSLPKILNQKFDIVFTSYGTIGWLPNIDKWANVVSHFLKPNGKFVFAEFHPVIWMYDDNLENITYKYFKDKPIIEETSGTYANVNAPIKDKSITWNYGLSEVINALINNGLTINQFNEFDYSPYNCFNQTEEFEKGKFRIKHLGNKIPMVFSIEATKK
jgi:ubiquinone/menaquinone biosynthesis C-methylase UbiE